MFVNHHKPTLPPPEIAVHPTEQPKILVMPSVIARAMALHKVNGIDIQEYTCLRQVCSIDDLAFMAAVHREAKAGGVDIGYYCFPLIFKNMLPEQHLELNDSVIPLSRTEEVAQAAADYLSSTETHTNFYELKSIGKTIIVVVAQGFAIYIQKPENRLVFLRDLIQSCERLSTPHEVAQTPIYQAYLQLTTSLIG